MTLQKKYPFISVVNNTNEDKFHNTLNYFKISSIDGSIVTNL